MSRKKSWFGSLAIACGAAGLLLAVVHFWAGPFNPEPTLGDALSQTAKEIREAASAIFEGEEAAAPQAPLDKDRITRIAVAVLGALGMIFAAIAHARGESAAAASGGAALGVAAIAFQLIVLVLARS